MVLVTQDPSGIHEGIGVFSQALGKQADLYQQRQQKKYEDEKQKQKLANYGNVIQEGLQRLGPNPTLQQREQFISDLIKVGVPQEYIKYFVDAYAQQQKSELKQQEQDSFLRSLGVNIPGISGNNTDLLGTLSSQDQQSVIGSLSNLSPNTGISQSDLPSFLNFTQPGQQPQRESLFDEINVERMAPVQPGESGVSVLNRPEDSIPSRIQSPLQNLSEEQLSILAAAPFKNIANFANFEQKRREVATKNFREDRKFNYDRNSALFDQVDTIETNIGDQKQALYSMEDAIRTGNTNFFSLDNFANFLGQYGEGLRTAKGTQLLTAQKEFLISDISKAGPRPNMWIEQQMSSALTKLGRSNESNLTVVEGLKAKVERNEAKKDLTRKLENEYLQRDGTIPQNFTQIVNEHMKPIEKKIQDKLAYKTRELYEQENAGKLDDMMNKKVSYGTPLTLKMAEKFLGKYGTKEKAINNAKKLGYTVPTAEEYRSFLR